MEILDRITELAPPRKAVDLATALEVIRNEFPGVTDFERTFPSLCFALATGVGKTRLMGAFIAYLHQAHGMNTFFVLAPNLTIYDKLIADFTPGTAKYVFKGISEFAVLPPELITGDNFESRGTLLDDVIHCKINIFNISKIASEVRGGRNLKMRSFRETLGDSYFDYLAKQPDLVLIMDESHRYRATAGVRALNELGPVLGLELTATPFVETGKGPVPFKNVVLDYPLGRAMIDGFVKTPAVVTRRDFDPAGKTTAELEDIKLRDGVRLHEAVKVELETYALQTGRLTLQGDAKVKPFVLVIARDTAHAADLTARIRSPDFFDGRYADKVIQVDSSVKEEETVARLLNVERTNEPTEIVVHVNMLKEGWDVTNLYTIVPLRAANARTLIEQSIGRGLRLPYGERTGVAAVDRLNIVAHDRFQEIVDEANRPGSTLRLQQLILDPETLARRTTTVVSRPRLAAELGIVAESSDGEVMGMESGDASVFDHNERAVAQLAYSAIRRLETGPGRLDGVRQLSTPEVQAALVEAVERQLQPAQLTLAGIVTPPNVSAVVAKTVGLVVQRTIDIPRILVVPKGEVKSGFRPFTLDLSSVRPPAEDQSLWVQNLIDGGVEIYGLTDTARRERRPEDYIVSALIDYPDIAYDHHADLLYDFAGQVVEHLRGYLSDAQLPSVLQSNARAIASLVHAQMQKHYWEESDAGFEVVIRRGFTSRLRDSAYSALADEPVLDFRISPADKSNMSRYRFGGFRHCLYDVQKFQSDAERRLAVILDRESEKWFKPAKGEFQIFYRRAADQPEYVPDFVAETANAILMLEPKAANQVDDADVLAKRAAAETWCARASDHALSYGGKPWVYALIPHDAIAENMTLAALVGRYRKEPLLVDTIR